MALWLFGWSCRTLNRNIAHKHTLEGYKNFKQPMTLQVGNDRTLDVWCPSRKAPSQDTISWVRSIRPLWHAVRVSGVRLEQNMMFECGVGEVARRTRRKNDKYVYPWLRRFIDCAKMVRSGWQTFEWYIRGLCILFLHPVWAAKKHDDGIPWSFWFVSVLWAFASSNNRCMSPGDDWVHREVAWTWLHWTQWPRGPRDAG